MLFQWIAEKKAGIEEINIEGMSGKTSFEQRRIFRKVGRSLSQDCQIDLREELCEKEQAEFVTLLIEAMMQGGYTFGKDALKKSKEQGIYGVRDSLSLYPNHKVYLISQIPLQEMIDSSKSLGLSIGYARMLGDLPGNFLHREELCTYLKEMTESLPISLKVFGNKELEEMGCGGILAVNQACEREAGLIVLTYEGKKGAPITALVGKGILFDAGGYHLKSIDGMEGMKYDMCGAADVIAMIEYAATQGQAVNVTAVIPIAENVISPEGLKMGDVIDTMSGKTVEVYNTDAEGRLILCDALTYACRLENVETVLDFATLTYSCKNAIGDEMAGLFCNDENLYNSLISAAEKTGEKVWRLPLDETFHQRLKWSKTADLANYAPKKGAGASIAACFLEEFIENNVKWAHFDMAAPAVETKDSEEFQAGATGRIIAMAAAHLAKDCRK